MPDPIEATALRASDSMVITAWWDAPSPDVKEWFNLRSIKVDETGMGAIRTIRLSRAEALRLSQVITNGSE